MQTDAPDPAPSSDVRRLSSSRRRRARLGEPLHEASDAALLERARRSDVAAFGELYRRHVRDARRYADRLTGRRLSGNLAEDAVSEASRKVLNALLDGNGPRATFRAYLFTAIRNVARSMMEAESILASRPHSPPSQSTESIDRDDAIVATSALATLPAHWQKVLWSIDGLGLTPTQTASRLGMSPSGVVMMTNRARGAMRAAYARSHLPPARERTCQRALDLLTRRAFIGLGEQQSRTLTNHVALCNDCAAAENALARHLETWAIGGEYSRRNFDRAREAEAAERSAS